MPTLINFDSFCEDLKEVTTGKVFNKKFFHPEGLFSEQIFGPLKNYTCQCGTYYGPSGSGGTCGMCGIDIVSSTERRRRFAKITLPHPVVNPIFYDLLVDLSGQRSDLRGVLDQLMKQEDSMMFVEEETGEYVVTSDPDVLEAQDTKYNGVEAIEVLVDSIANDYISNGDDKWKIVQDNMDKLIINHIIVLPPDLRPASKHMTKGNPVNMDKINRFYTSILTKKEVMEETRLDITRRAELKFSYYKNLQKVVNELYQFILEKLSKKEGLIRGNILGKRIDFSGRSVIVPDPTLKIDECSLPYLMFLELFKIQVAKKLIYLGKFKLFNKAIDFVDECIETKNDTLFPLCESLTDGEYCILNRQPSLHRLSILGFKIKISLHSIIKIHPLVCPPFNADFDGDQMAVYIPISEESKQEVIDKLIVTKNLINPANGTLATKPSQDMVLGIYALTNEEFPNLNNKIEYKGDEISEARKIFNDCLPKDYPLIDRVIRSKDLVFILTDIQRKYKEDIIAEVLDNIKLIGFKYSTLYGATMSLDDCYIEGYKEIKDEIYNQENIIEQLKGISSDEVKHFMRDNFKYSYMVESGARGSWDQVRQILFSRGFISNFDGEIIPEPIKSNYLEGMTPKEFFNSTYGSRKGLLDVALNTGTSGYLSRKLIFSCVNLMLDESSEDCGTQDFLSVYVGNDKKARMLVGKWMKSENNGLELIDEINWRDLIGQTILIRSPIYCLNDRICKVCYGEMYKLMNSRFVGIVAAQSIGECNTQLVLRTFHISGLAILNSNSDEQDMTQKDIVNDLSRASKLLHSDKTKNFETLTSDLFDIYNTGRPIHHVHFECVVSQLMWSGMRKWRLKQNRNEHIPKFQSVQVVPSFESWLMGLAFSNPRKHIIKGILNEGNYRGVFDKMLCGDRI